MTIDPETVAALIGEIAQEEIASRFGRLNKAEISEKSGPNDLVTDVDRATERALRKALTGIAPNAGFIGEELAAQTPEIENALTGGGAFWIVDPLDGTRNFVTGVKEFGAIVAYVEGGVALFGWIYLVPESACAIAEKGRGAFWRGEPIGIQKRRREPPLGLRSLGRLSEERQTRMRAKLAESFETKPGHCSAYAYLALARGDVDFKISTRIHPWDHVAGALLVTEAGGAVAFLDDASPYAPQPTIEKPLLAVAPGRSWSNIAEKLLD